MLYRLGGKLLLHRLGFRAAKGLWIFDDAACVDWHRVRPERVVGRLRHPSPFSRGALGLAYGLLVRMLFLVRRWLNSIVVKMGAAARGV